MALFKCDLHIHSIASGHAFNTIDECARYSHDNHYALIGISDHGPNMEGAPHMGYFEMMYRLPRHNQGVSMIYGCEANILSEYGDVDISDDILQKLDYTMAGLHKRTQYVDRGEMNNTAAIVNTIKSGDNNWLMTPLALCLSRCNPCSATRTIDFYNFLGHFSSSFWLMPTFSTRFKEIGKISLFST